MSHLTCSNASTAGQPPCVGEDTLITTAFMVFRAQELAPGSGSPPAPSLGGETTRHPGSRGLDLRPAEDIYLWFI